MAKKARRTARKRTKSGKAKAARRTPSTKRTGNKRRARAQSPPGSRSTRKKTARKAIRAARPRRGGTGREETLAQTPETGRTRPGPTNPQPTKRSTGTPSGAGTVRQAPSLDRARRQLRDVDETIPSPPSSLDPNRRTASAARSGRQELKEALREHRETGPELTGGDIDADWEDAYSVGDEAPGGDNPTPDQDRVDDIGRALGVEYQDNEPLKGSDKLTERDRHRWELDPASSEDYEERD
jgi:hypothetical protein